MQFTIEKGIIKIDLPLAITQVMNSFQYYDNDLKKKRFTHVGNWVVDDNEQTPKNFKIAVKEFREPKGAVVYANCIYRQYLREELRRIIDDC